MKKFNNYFDEIFRTSKENLIKILDDNELNKLYKNLANKVFDNNIEYIDCFIREYSRLIKTKHQLGYNGADNKINNFINEKHSKIK